MADVQSVDAVYSHVYISQEEKRPRFLFVSTTSAQCVAEDFCEVLYLNILRAL